MYNSLNPLLLTLLFTLIALLGGACLAGTAIDTTPRALLYADFNSEQRLSAGLDQIFFRVSLSDGKMGKGALVARGVGVDSRNIHFGGRRFDPRRGSLACWVKCNNAVIDGQPELITINQGPLHLSISAAPQRPDATDAGKLLPGNITVAVGMGDHWRDQYEVNDTLSTPGFAFQPGEWHHLVWTWAGMQNTFYLDGKLAAEKIFVSPFPPEWPEDLEIGPSGYSLQNMTLDELAIYNFVMTPTEVHACWQATTSTPITPGPVHGLSFTAAWGPGEGAVHVSADAGNDFETRAVACLAEALNGQGAVLASTKITSLRRGFGETILRLGNMAPGSYTARVTLLDARGAKLATATSAAYDLPATPWLYNKSGVSDAIQPPWTPITRKGNALQVIGRDYQLAGGFGLPQQITSLGQSLLAKPIGLEIYQGAKTLPYSNAHVAITESKPGVARWQGAASAGAVRVAVTGRLEYDGMLMLTMRLTPSGAPVHIDGMHLNMVLPPERALYTHTATAYYWNSQKDNQLIWPDTFKGWTPTTPGVYHTNLQNLADMARFMPVVVFSDNDRGLQWFAQNPSGWQVDNTSPMQELIRDADGSVRLQCNLANKPFELDHPIEITFGLEATPVKPLPANWRATFMNYAPGPYKNGINIWWNWPDGAGQKARQGTFNLYPVDIAGYREALSNFRNTGVKVAPFTNAHVLVAHPPDTEATFNHLLGGEISSDGWIAMPSRGFRDYWAYQLNRWLDGDGMDAIYIDEAFLIANVNANLLSGCGYIKEDGTHGAGYNLLGTREQLKRTRQLLIDHHKQPLVWLHTTESMYPNVWAFADIVSDGEAYMFEKPEDPDWIDLLGARLLDRNAGFGAIGGPWLLSISRAQKFGFIPLFLNYIKFYNKPEYLPALRAQHGLLGLLDILPIEQAGDPTFAQSRATFDIGNPDVTFHGFWEQTALSTGQNEVKASYYTHPGKALIIITNLSPQPFTGWVSINIKTLGLDPGKAVIRNAEKPESAPLPITDGKVTITIPRHDYVMLAVDDE